MRAPPGSHVSAALSVVAKAIHSQPPPATQLSELARKVAVKIPSVTGMTSVIEPELALAGEAARRTAASANRMPRHMQQFYTRKRRRGRRGTCASFLYKR